jgi:sulfoxide reductase heme-binding subunit YedZ
LAAVPARLEPPAALVRLVVHLGALTPFLLLVWDGYRRALTANPIQAITQRTGYAALVILVLAFLCTPLNAVFGLRWAVPPRRTLGLYAFFYACLHVFTFSVVDYALDWQLLAEQLVEKNYIIAGFTAFVLLIPLAITSTKGWQRRLGKRWRLLHRAAYVATPLAVIHFLWNAKGGADRNEPLLFGALVVVLLLLRLPLITRWARNVRRPARARTLVLE